ncbi:MAG TPA: galactokinase [Myxococcota bacterium]|nr:galactokinase [Myxococcota bacterium]HPB50554.1 galactokinase [Myxococcota bacterium]HQP95657.1 galactokinase [Myxococcota bacterium]
MIDSNLIDRVSSAFRSAFGREPAAWSDAGGRVNIIGEHTDYHDGFVLPAAIDLRTCAVGAPRDDGILRILAVDVGATVEVDVADFGPFDVVDWRSYTCGPFWAWRESGFALGGADVAVGGDVPQGGGLSSSAAMEVSLLGIAATLSGATPSCAELATIARMAENRFCRVPCGIMDQMASACGQAGKALLMDCRSLETTPVGVWPGWVIVVADSGVRHSLASGEYAKRQMECAAGMEVIQSTWGAEVKAARDVTMQMLESVRSSMPSVSYRRLRHAVTENDRTVRAARALAGGDAGLVGGLMAGSHISLALDYEVSCAELDKLVAIAGGIEGCVGARLTGAGFGGNTVNLVEEAAAPSFCEELAARYLAQTGIESRIRVVRPAAGLQSGLF